MCLLTPNKTLEPLALEQAETQAENQATTALKEIKEGPVIDRCWWGGTVIGRGVREALALAEAEKIVSLSVEDAPQGGSGPAQGSRQEAAG